ncbi:TetR/AcrR family transcriptional regulator [Nocardioides sp. BP30]|uniref:TetR/AcrR family transcriptional regulator n=1 Tax=Nocardioides sp. BP30 TaxID=3036374 RepID=UPI0024695AD7|nr:TetR/AcrR family transcriptional regulator [Nocardioides sp. BP30]WGL52123.1 TetR/AcrR family transcriptional regulator [Nocardioides sp. BP30]
MAKGREAQRRRTRRDLVDAAQRLLLEGRNPSIDEIAAAADVSRRTVYLHFSTLDQLLLDASVGLLSAQAVDDVLDSDTAPTDPVDRIEALVRSLWSTADRTLPLGRQIIRLTVADAPGHAGAAEPEQRRGHRRIEWIEKALAPLADTLEPADFERLVSALAVLIGWEAMTVLEDVRGTGTHAQTETVVWASRALVESALRGPVT